MRARVPAADVTLDARRGRRDPDRALVQVHARVVRAPASRGTGLVLERWITDPAEPLRVGPAEAAVTLERLARGVAALRPPLRPPRRRGLARAADRAAPALPLLPRPPPRLRVEPPRPRPPRPARLPAGLRRGSSSAASTPSASTPTCRRPRGPSARRSSTTGIASAGSWPKPCPTPACPREGGPVVAMVVEHELMHHETLQYMVQELDHGLKAAPARLAGRCRQRPSRGRRGPSRYRRAKPSSAPRRARCPSAGTTSSRSGASTCLASRSTTAPSRTRTSSSSCATAAMPIPACGARMTGRGGCGGASTSRTRGFATATAFACAACSRTSPSIAPRAGRQW